MTQSWTEHETCARCGARLGEEFGSNHLGVRFCLACFQGAVQSREQDRVREQVLDHVCNRCRGSLINGYQANYMGVLFCSTCFDQTHTPDGRPRTDWAEREGLSVAQRPRDQVEEEGDSRSMEEEEGVYLHDVFFVTTLVALVMYAFSRFGHALLALGGF